ncbi:MAG: SRPBCC family protein [Bacteroidota bacterium]|nr:SRPBCC family protein [Bacteroidota bacterium]
MKVTNSKTKQLNRRALIAVGLTSLLCWGFSFLGTNVFRDYALGLFIWLPLVLGTTSTLLYGYNHTTEKRRLFGISMWTLLVFCLGLLVFAWEGIICLVMAFPIGVFFTWVGHLLGFELLRSKVRNTSATIILFFLSVPSLMAFENLKQDKEEVRSVTTSIAINATPEQVWKNVVAFPQLKEPTEFIFKTGIAYPINATIQGQGVGAVRHCNFSTGSFVEPITVWDEPRLLQFSVEQQPEPMKELSFYNIHPNHLHGYWISKRGQFKLTQLSDGRTLLEGTTWYVNKIKPDLYWTVWSDYIVHKIHRRVLENIKKASER